MGLSVAGLFRRDEGLDLGQGPGVGGVNPGRPGKEHVHHLQKSTTVVFLERLLRRSDADARIFLQNL